MSETQTMTAEHFLEWVRRSGEENCRFELDHGRVVTVPFGSVLHGVVCWIASVVLTEYLKGRVGYILMNQQVRCGRDPDTVLSADLLLFLEPLHSESGDLPRFDTRPALIVDVIDVFESHAGLTRRMQRYMEWGVGLLWFVDPVERAVIVSKPGRIPQVLQSTEEITGNGVLPDFLCKVADLFTLPGQTPAMTSPSTP